MPALTVAGVPVSTSQGSSTTMPPGCTLSFNAANRSASLFFNTYTNSSACCGAAVTAIKGSQHVTLGADAVAVALALDSAAHGNVTITVSGPVGRWFGVGFDTISMSNSPYAIVVDGTGAITEHVMGEHEAGVQINTSVTVVSSSVSGTVRTVVMTRGLVGVTPQHHSFDPLKLQLDIIAAVGSTPTLSYVLASIPSSR
jgi:hypothetical protein